MAIECVLIVSTEQTHVVEMLCYLLVSRSIPVGSCDGGPSGDLEVLDKKKPVSSKKTVTKVASLKKLINKNIKLNSHIKFDDHGSAVEDSSSSKGRYDNLEDHEDSGSGSEAGDSITPVPISEYESKPGDVKVGGIEISRARKKIVARDKVDKKLERQRIQQAHRQRRLKKRKHMVTAEQPTSVARLGGGLSDEDEGGGQSSDSEMTGRETKRRRRQERSMTEENEQLGTSFEPLLKEDEELAKHLLGL